MSLRCTPDGFRMGSNGTYVVPLLTVGVGAAVAGGTAPSKPDEVKGGGRGESDFDPTVVLSKRTLLQKTLGHVRLPVVDRGGGQLRYVGQAFSGVVSEFGQILTWRS